MLSAMFTRISRVLLLLLPVMVAGSASAAAQTTSPATSNALPATRTGEDIYKATCIT